MPVGDFECCEPYMKLLFAWYMSVVLELSRIGKKLNIRRYYSMLEELSSNFRQMHKVTSNEERVFYNSKVVWEKELILVFISKSLSEKRVHLAISCPVKVEKNSSLLPSHFVLCLFHTVFFFHLSVVQHMLAFVRFLSFITWALFISKKLSSHLNMTR